MTWAFHVPGATTARAISSRATWVSRRRSAARDMRCSCPNLSTILSIAARLCAPSPARDIGGSAPFPATPSARCFYFRARSSTRTPARFALRSSFCCWARRRSLQAFPHVCWMVAVDGPGRYQARHMLQRRRPVLLLVVTTRRWLGHASSPTSRPQIRLAPFTSPGRISGWPPPRHPQTVAKDWRPRDLARRPGRGGQAADVDLKTAAGWISGWPPPKR